MNREDIIKMAREAGLRLDKHNGGFVDQSALIRFAALVAAAELRRLHEVNQELLEALQRIKHHFDTDEYAWRIAEVAIAKAGRTTMTDKTKEALKLALEEQVAKIMEQAQVFASAWSLVGGRFDGGNAMDDAEIAKNELRQMVAEALAEESSGTEQPAIPTVITCPFCESKHVPGWLHDYNMDRNAHVEQPAQQWEDETAKVPDHVWVTPKLRPLAKLAHEQPAQQCWKCGDMDSAFQAKCTVPSCGMKEQPAQQQEPVAYMVKAHGMLQRLSRRADVADELACKYREDDPNAEVLPLYTSPPAQPQQEHDRVKFERHWRKTRGEKKANRELPRHPLQPQTYIQDSANRHWVTWQAAVRSVASPAQRKPWVGLAEEEVEQGLLRSDYALQTAHAWRAGVVFAITKLKEKNT